MAVWLPAVNRRGRLRRAHRDRVHQEGERPADGLVQLYGLHTVRAALDNPARRLRQPPSRR